MQPMVLEKKTNDNNKEVAAVISEIILILLLWIFEWSADELQMVLCSFKNMLRPSKVLVSVISFV